MSEHREQSHRDGCLHGRYLIVRVLGKGGFGVTYECVDTALKETVAVKELFSHESLQEYEILKKLSKVSGVVHVRDWFEENGTCFLVMDYLKGISLRKYVLQKERISADEVFGNMESLFSALGNIHRAGLVHRDLSPDNIMVSDNGDFCLIDFGAACPAGLPPNGQRQTVGKPGYAPCEAYVSGEEYGPESDIYSLCAVLYFCLTGLDPEDSLQRLLLDELKKPSELGVSVYPEQEAMIMKGLMLEKQDRWQNIDEILKFLEQENRNRREAGKYRRNLRLLRNMAITTGILLLLVIGFLVFLHQNRNQFNDRYQTAFGFTAGDRVHDRIERFSSADYFVLENPEDGELNIRFEHSYKSSGEGSGSGWTVNVYEGQQEKQSLLFSRTVFLNDNEKLLLDPLPLKQANRYYVVISGLDANIEGEDYVFESWYSPASIALTPESLDLLIHSDSSLAARIEPAFAAQGLTWTSSDPEVVSVDENGTVTALRYGVADVTVFSSENRKIKSSCRIHTLFYDVSDRDLACYDAVYWAMDHNVASGYDGAFFGAEKECTRRDAALFLWKLAGQPDAERDTGIRDPGYEPDSDSYQALNWAVAAGILDIFPDGTFGAKEPLSRGEAMTVLYRYAGSPDVYWESGFTDLTNDGTELFRACLWCRQAGLDEGYPDGTMRPDAACSRGAMILMVYQYSQK